MAENRPLTPLDIKNAEERRIILEGPKDPDNFQMPDGRTLTETRQQMLEKHTKEGIAAEDMQTSRAKQLSIQGDPLYDTSRNVVSDEQGGFREVSGEKGPGTVNKETPVTPTQPLVSTTTPEKDGVVTGDKAVKESKDLDKKD